MRITLDQIEAAYTVASAVFDNELAFEAGKNSLSSEYGLNINTAADFISNYRHMLRGECFYRTINAPAMDLFLARIKAERGTESLQQSLRAVCQHISYYEEHESVTLHKLREVVVSWFSLKWKRRLAS
jgi:5-methylcytosine-specific restriction enzyme A